MVDEKPKRTRKRNASVEIRDSTVGTGGGDIVGQDKVLGAKVYIDKMIVGVPPSPYELAKGGRVEMAPKPPADFIERPAEFARDAKLTERWRYTMPYRGLSAMEEKDSDYFFGRERKTVEVLNVLAAQSGRLSVLLGNSGVRKSSLAQAGVIAGLRRQAWPETDGDMREKVLGPEHPYTATSLSNLARLLSKAGRSSDAEPLFRRAISIGEKALGQAHPLTQRYRSHCARLLLDTGRPVEALHLAQAAVATHETASGPNHPWTKDSASVTADALSALGRA
jgi:hypothetical protein